MATPYLHADHKREARDWADIAITGAHIDRGERLALVGQVHAILAVAEAIEALTGAIRTHCEGQPS